MDCRTTHLYRNFGIRPVQIPQIDVIRLQPLQGRLELLHRVFRFSIRTLGRVSQPKLGRKEDVFALACAREPVSDEDLTVTVRVGGVPKRAASCIRPV